MKRIWIDPNMTDQEIVDLLESVDVSDEDEVSKHDGPGPHSGTGTSQKVHGKGKDRSAAEGAIKDVESATGRATGEIVDFRAPGQLADDVTAITMQDAKDVFEAELFNHSNGETYTAHVNDVYPQVIDGETHMIVQGHILWDTAPGADESGGAIEIGYFRRRLQPGGIVYNGSFDISEDFQGQGIGTMLFSHWEDELANAGFTRMDVSATSIGKYAWAVAGYDWRNFQHEVMADAKKWVTFYDSNSRVLLPDTIRDDDESFFELRIFVEDWEDANIYPAPVDLALIGYNRQVDTGGGTPTHFGKEFLLSTEGWGGTKELKVRKSLDDVRFVWKAWAENRPAGVEADDPEFLADLADALDGHYPEEEDVEKHADHDQSTHGNWANAPRQRQSRDVAELLGIQDQNVLVDRLIENEGAYLDTLIEGTGLWWMRGIREHGVRDPIVIKVQDNGRETIWDGMHRLAAAVQLGLSELPVTYINEGGDPITKSGVLTPGFGSKRKRRNQLVQRLKSTRRYDPPVRGGKKKKRRSSLARNIIRRRKGGKRF